MKTLRRQSGYIMLTALVVGVVLSMLGTIGAQVLINNARFAKFEERQSKALDVAEAGINYYLWHLSHNPTDYKDGGTTPTTAPYGPYAHNYYDNDGNLVGVFTLTITPPGNGGTITTVKSVGTVPNMQGSRTIQAQIGQPSFANYALLTATEVWIGTNETVTGPLHSNVGVHMDGTNLGAVTSAQATYKPSPQFGGDGTIHNGVWGLGGPSSQWKYPVPSVDFSAVTADYNTCIASAQSNGIYLAQTNKIGYYLKLRSDGKIDEYIVKNETSSGISFTTGSPIATLSPPANGIIYVEDNVWVEGTNFPGRINILSGRLPDVPATNTSITIVGNLTYAAKDGSAVIGLIAQNNVSIAIYAPTTMEVDAAALAQKGNVWFPNNGPVKTNLTYYGAIDSYNTWTWNWVNGGGNVISGFQTDSTTFDTNLTYGPPPCFPTTGSYSILNWRELLYNP